MGIVGFADPHWGSIDAAVGRGSLVRTGQCFDTTPTLGDWRRRDALLLPGRGGSPGSHMVSTDTVKDALPDGTKDLVSYLVFCGTTLLGFGAPC